MISSSLKNMIRDQHVEVEEQQQPSSCASSSSSRERSSSVRIINDDNDEGYTSVANHEVVETEDDPPSSSGLKYNIEAEPIDPPAPGYGGASYASSPTYGGGMDNGFGQMNNSRPDEDHSKRGKKSIALQALNKNVLLWAGFFTVSLFVYSLLSGGDFSFLMTYGAMARMFGFGILNLKTFKSQRSTGISAKTLQLYSLVFFFRLTSIIRHEGYLPYDKSGDWLYYIIEMAALIFTASALYGISFPFKSTYEADSDRFGEVGVPPGYGAVYLAVPTLIIALLLHPNLNEDFFSDVAWTYAMYLESLAVIPQLYMFQKQKTGVVEIMNAHFVAALGFGRVMEFTFWIYSYHELSTTSGSNLPGYLAIISQFLQLVLMVDFFWYYITAVKNATPLVLPSHGGNNMV